MKGTDSFKEAILEHLKQKAFNEPEFEKKFEDPKKNIDDCTTYILNTVKESGSNGFTDAEVYGMANHYYDESEIDIGKEVSAQVIINKTVEFTNEEKATIKQEAKEKLVEKAMVEMRTPKKRKKKVEVQEQKSLF